MKINTSNGILMVANLIEYNQPINQIYHVYLPYSMEPGDYFYAEYLLTHRRDGVVLHYTAEDLK